MDLEDFAVLVAALNDPFATRAHVLALRGIDEAVLVDETAAWGETLKRDVSLRARYQAAFRAERDRLRAPQPTSSPGASAASPMSDVDLLRARSGPVAALTPAPTERLDSRDPLDVTGRVFTRVAGVLPFVERDDLGIPIATIDAAKRVSDGETGTLLLDPSAPQTAPPTPFATPRASGASQAPQPAPDQEDDLARTVEMRLPLLEPTNGNKS